MKANDVVWIRVSTIGGGLRSDAETERHVGHRIHDHTLIPSSVLGDSSKTRLQHVIAVQVLLLGRRLQPDLVLGVRRDVVERRDGQSELVAVRVLADTGAERRELIATNVRGILQHFLAHVVDTIIVQPEAVRAIGTVNQLSHVLADVFSELLEDILRLFRCQWSHD